MKVLQIIDSLPTGGGARFIVNFVQQLRREGVSVEVLLMDGTHTDFYQKLNESGATIYSLTKGKRWDIRNTFRIMPYFNRYDLVHVHIFPGSYYTAVAKFLSGSKTPLVFTEHNSQNRRATHPLFKYIEKWIYGRFSATICLTDDVREFVKKNLNVREDQLTVIPNGIDTEEIENTIPYEKIDFGWKNKKLILMAARFEDQKDHETAVKCMQYLPESFHLLFAGEGSMRVIISKLSDQLGLSERVHFLGNRSDIFKLMKMCDYQLLSSNFEGLSLSALESLSSGKPFLASRVSGLDFIGNTGILFERGNSHTLANEILKLDNNPEYYHAIATAGKNKAKEYSVRKMTEKYIQFYREIIQKK